MTEPLPPEPPATPHRAPIRIRPDVGWPSLGLGEVWRHRDLAWSFTGRELKLRYRQTAFGVLWFVLQPLILAATFSFVFGSVARMPSEGAPRFVFTFAGVLGWNLFSHIVTRGGDSLVQNASLLSKVFFPRELLPLSMVPLGLTDFVVALAFFAALAAAGGIHPTVALLTLPFWVVLVCVLASGVALLISALTVWYRDMHFLVNLGLQLLLYLSPLAYSLASVPPRFRPFAAANPLAPILEGFRWSLLGIGGVSAGQVLYSTAFALSTFIAGLLVFRVLERRFADVV